MSAKRTTKLKMHNSRTLFCLIVLISEQAHSVPVLAEEAPKPTEVRSINRRKDCVDRADNHCRAFNYFRRGKNAEALKTLQEMVSDAFHNPLFKGEDALLLADMARIYETQGDYRKANDLLRKSLGQTETALWPAHPDCLRIRSRLIKNLVHLKGYAEAKPLVLKQISLLQPSGTGPAQLFAYHAILMNLLAETDDTDCLKEMHVLLELSREMHKQPLACNIATANAGILRSKQDWKTAEALYRIAFELRDFDTSPDMTAYMIGACCWSQGKLSDAQKFISEAVELRQQRFAENDATTLGFIESLARVNLDLKNISEARRILTKLVAASVNTGNREQTASALCYLGSAESRAGNLHDAEKYCLQSASLYKALGQSCKVKRTVPLSLLAELYQQKHSGAKAIAMLNEIALCNPEFANSEEYKARLRMAMNQKPPRTSVR